MEVIDIKTSERLTSRLDLFAQYPGGKFNSRRGPVLKISEIKKDRNINDSVMTRCGVVRGGGTRPLNFSLLKNII